MSHASASANPYTDYCTLVNGKKAHLYNKTIDRSEHKQILKNVLGDEYDEAFFNGNFDYIKSLCVSVIWHLLPSSCGWRRNVPPGWVIDCNVKFCS